MLLGITYQLVLFIADFVLVRTRSDAELRAELHPLRDQLCVLDRRVRKPVGATAGHHLDQAAREYIKSRTSSSRDSTNE
jgi:hypothetical protein